jgi:hypothetical protein
MHTGSLRPLAGKGEKKNRDRSFENEKKAGKKTRICLHLEFWGTWFVESGTDISGKPAQRV